MASPSACGAGAMLFQLYQTETSERPAASTIKALMIHGAEDKGRPGPDYEYGWGLINAKTSADLIKSKSWRTGTASQGTHSSYQVVIPNGQPELKATLVWTDVPGSIYAAVALVNNLDPGASQPIGHGLLSLGFEPHEPHSPCNQRRK